MVNSMTGDDDVCNDTKWWRSQWLEMMVVKGTWDDVDYNAMRLWWL